MAIEYYTQKFSSDNYGAKLLAEGKI